MEKLLEIARREADKVEVFSQATTSDEVSFENAALKNIESSLLSGVGLIVMKDGRLGMAYARNLDDRERLVRNAFDALAGGVEADYQLAPPSAPAALDTWDPAIEEQGSAKLVDECDRLAELLKQRTKGQVNLMARRGLTTVRVLNSEGFDGTVHNSSYQGHYAVHFPGSYASVGGVTTGKGFVPTSEEDLGRVADLFNAAETEIRPRSGPTKVLFLPSCMYTLMWRLTAATTGRTVYEKVSPLREKLGEQVLSPELTLEDVPLDDSQAGARSFDDEGTQCRDRLVFEKGVLKAFHTNRYYAWKLGVEPSGNGWRSDITSRPAPGLDHLRLRPGGHSFADLLKEMKEGVIVGGALGAHSGNILNGDYSIGLSPGLWVENGEVVGHVKDSMIAGNVYEDLKRVVAVGDQLEDAYMGCFPPLLLDGVSFSGRG